MEIQVEQKGLPTNYKVLDQLTVGDILRRFRDEVIAGSKSAEIDTDIINAFLRRSIGGRRGKHLGARVPQVGPFARRHRTSIRAARGSPGELSRQAVEQDIELARGLPIASAQNCMGLTGKAARRFGMARVRQFLQTRPENPGEPTRRRGRVGRDGFLRDGRTPRHQPPSSCIPKCRLASGLIICGVQGGS